MSIVGWVILGLVAGALAKALFPGPTPYGFVVTTVIGIIGAVVGGAIARALGLGDPIDEFFDLSTWVAAILGALVLLTVLRSLGGRYDHKRARS